ncbi:hypothetical protein [Umezawaea beigongshangensis]|uniref:hypothetical protein n=1 Tax=Umezawaea beigongshangensis TaxID=2780383 RepID=UPI0018F187E7|nr:hypothetical protein [Umezawaea beigongshangensis]
MGDLATLLTAIGGLIMTSASAFALVYTTVRRSGGERRDTARAVVEDLAAAAEDGEITPDELTQALRRLTEEEPQ